MEFAKGKNVVTFGEAGDKFYTIIEGKVNVQIPNPGIKHWKDHRHRLKKLKSWYDDELTPCINKAKEKFLETSEDENKE